MFDLVRSRLLEDATRNGFICLKGKDRRPTCDLIPNTRRTLAFQILCTSLVKMPIGIAYSSEVSGTG